MPDPQGLVALVLEDGQLPTDTSARAFRFLTVDANGVAVSDTDAAASKVTIVDAGGTNITDTTFNTLTVKKFAVQVATSTDTLDTGGVFTGASVNVSGLERIVGYAFSDQPSAASGLSVRQSLNDTNWDYTETFSVVASTALPFSVEVVGDRASIQYTNGADTAQDTMRLIANAR